jgi:hypothetical protein
LTFAQLFHELQNFLAVPIIPDSVYYWGTKQDMFRIVSHHETALMHLKYEGKTQDNPSFGKKNIGFHH